MRGYTREGAEPILCDRDACEALGVEVITAPCPRWKTGWCAIIRAIWRKLVRLHAQRNIRSVEDSQPDAEKPSGEMRKVCSHLRER